MSNKPAYIPRVATIAANWSVSSLDEKESSKMDKFEIRKKIYMPGQNSDLIGRDSPGIYYVSGGIIGN
jgi:hypothetical protein